MTSGTRLSVLRHSNIDNPRVYREVFRATRSPLHPSPLKPVGSPRSTALKPPCSRRRIATFCSFSPLPAVAPIHCSAPQREKLRFLVIQARRRSLTLVSCTLVSRDFDSLIRSPPPSVAASCDLSSDHIPSSTLEVG